MTEPRTSEPLLRVCGLGKSYLQRRVLTREKHRVRAFKGINLSILRGTTYAIVGESGAGKSSLARCLAMLEAPDSGEIWFEARDITKARANQLFTLRRKIQLIFQDPTTALNHRFTAAEIIAEPLRIQKMMTASERRERALELMKQVGLPAEWAGKLPHEFSGGQRQRLAIARALALEPKLLILDEALSGLDLANQEMILRFLADLQRRLSLTYIHISHDLRFVSRFAEEVAVMLDGKIVEQNRAEELFSRAQNPYTQQLLQAMPPLESILGQRTREQLA